MSGTFLNVCPEDSRRKALEFVSLCERAVIVLQIVEAKATNASRDPKLAMCFCWNKTGEVA